MEQATTGSVSPRGSQRRPVGPTSTLMAATADWVRNAVGADGASVQILLLDGDGHVSVITTSGKQVMGGRLRSARRRQVLGTGRPLRIAIRGPEGTSLEIRPLIVDDGVIGVVEIVAPTASLDGRADVVDAVIDQSAAVFRSVRDQHANDSALRTVVAELRLAAELLRAETSSAAVKSAVHLCFELVRAPVVGLLPDRSGTGWYVAAALGLGSARRAELRRSLDEVSVLISPTDGGARLAERFAAVVGTDAVALEAGAAVLLVAGPAEEEEGPIHASALLLAEALERLGEVGWARLRNANLDQAIAWTAHELKAPLVGVRTALAHVTVAEHDPDGRELLRQSRDELRRLSDLVDPLLRWSAGSGPLRMRRVDLARVVRDAAASCSLGSGERSLTLTVTERIVVRADERELRAAIANVIRNALGYSPSSAPVAVTVETHGEVARVLVRDRGPGVPAAERHLIFDPFARGSAGRATPGGHGLGLFISRRVIEAHGGAIGLRSVRPGSEFRIELPLADGEGSLSAS